MSVKRLLGLAAGLLLVAQPASVRAQDAICAEVRIEILQTVSLERQAFDAVLRINNGLDGIPVEDVSVNIVFQDESGNGVPGSSNPDDTSASFFVRLDSTEGLGGVAGDGRVAPKSSGTAKWLIVPAPGAGGALPSGRRYRVGATVQYTLGDQSLTAEVAPETITVRPQPRLELDYFLPRHVFSDDPFTSAVEPPEPFSLGVRVRNSGHGIARAVNIESAQPRIVENEQGLLIDFEILGSTVGGAPGSRSLLVDFGDIAPGESTTASWSMQTTLTGRFVSFAADYTHAPELGGAMTSLLDAVRTHELVRQVRVDLPGRDQEVDFLARDGDVLRIYESHGIDTVVADRSATASVQSAGNGRHRIDVPATGSFAFASIAHPAAARPGASLVARRADGSSLPLENAWISRVQNENLTYTWSFNLFDTAFAGPYEIEILDALPRSSLDGVVSLEGDADMPGMPLAGVSIRLEADAPGRDTAYGSTIMSQSDGSFAFRDIPAGSYVLTVGDVPGHVDGQHLPGSAGGAVDGARIVGILLDPGTEASGYRFAKRAFAAVDGADLGLDFSGVRLPATVESTFEVTLSLDNAGPRDASEVVVDLIVPEGLVIIEASTTAGSYDPALGRWEVPALAADASATARIRGRLGAPGEHILAAHVRELAAQAYDPNPDNDSARATLRIDPWSIELSRAESLRVLVLPFCATAGDCSPQYQTSLPDWLLGHGARRVHVARSTAEFEKELARGYWNAYWLKGTGMLIEDGLLTSLELALHRGETLMVDGDVGHATTDLGRDRIRRLLGLAGGDFPAVGDFSVRIPDESPLPAGNANGSGIWWRQPVTTATTLARFGSGGAAMTRNAVGAGYAYYVGVDVPGAGSGEVPDLLGTAWVPVLVPRPADVVDAGGVVTVVADLATGTTAEDVEVRLDMSPLDVDDVWPYGLRRGDHGVDWVVTNEPGMAYSFGASAIAPEAGTGMASVQAERSDVDVGLVSIGAAELPLSISDAAGFLAEAEAQLVAWAPGGEWEAARQEALQATARALEREAAEDPAGVRAAVAAVLTALRSAVDVPAREALRNVAFADKIALRSLPEENQCAMPRIVEGGGFMPLRPAQGVLGTAVINRWSFAVGEVDSIRAKQIASLPFRQAEYTFIYEHAPGGAGRLNLREHGRSVLDIAYPIRGDYDTFEIRLDLPPGLLQGPLAGILGLRVELVVEEVDGVDTDVSMVVDRHRGEARAFIRLPTDHQGGAIRGVMRIAGLPLAGLTTGPTIRILHGTAPCEAP